MVVLEEPGLAGLNPSSGEQKGPGPAMKLPELLGIALGVIVAITYGFGFVIAQAPALSYDTVLLLPHETYLYLGFYAWFVLAGKVLGFAAVVSVLRGSPKGIIGLSRSCRQSMKLAWSSRRLAATLGSDQSELLANDARDISNDAKNMFGIAIREFALAATNLALIVGVLVFGWWLTGIRVQESLALNAPRFVVSLLSLLLGWIVGGSPEIRRSLWGDFGRDRFKAAQEVLLVVAFVFLLGASYGLSRELPICNVELTQRLDPAFAVAEEHDGRPVYKLQLLGSNAEEFYLCSDEQGLVIIPRSLIVSVWRPPSSSKPRK